MIEFRLPSLGADMESAKLVEWLVTPGQHVKRGDLVAVIETEKGAVELEIWDDGVIDALDAEIGQDIPVGGLLAHLRPDVEPATAPAAPHAEASTVDTQPPRPRISPAARKRAQELGVDVSALSTRAADGVISITDVEATAPSSQPASADDRLDAMRSAIALAMTRSKREIPHYYLGTTLDVGAALDWLTAENARRGVKERILFAAVMLKATAMALRTVPELNGFWVNGRFQPAESIHLGVAIALRGGGLIAPALHDADKLSLADTMAGLSSLVQRARSGSLRSSELTDSTVTVTNLGEQGVETVYGVIYPPQVALIGLGKVVERPWVRDGQVQVARVLHASLSADHRASVGHRGALFLVELERILKQPESIS